MSTRRSNYCPILRCQEPTTPLLTLGEPRWKHTITGHFGRSLMTGSGSVSKTCLRIRSTCHPSFPHLRHSTSALKKPISQDGGLANSKLQELLPYTAFGPCSSYSSSAQRLRCLIHSRLSNLCISSQLICACSLSLQASTSLGQESISPDPLMWCRHQGLSQLTQCKQTMSCTTPRIQSIG